MLIVALVLAVIGLAALVTAVVTNNELIAWVCIGASGLGVLLLVVDAIRERAQRRSLPAAETTEFIEPVVPAGIAVSESTELIAPVDSTEVLEPVTEAAAEPEAEDLAEEVAVEDHPDELVHDEPDYDMPSDDEQDFPQPAEEAALHVIDEEDVAAEDVLEGDLAEEDIVGEDVLAAEDLDAEDLDTGDLDAGDLGVAVAGSGDAATVVSYVDQPQSAETEYRYVESSDTGYTVIESYVVTDSTATDSGATDDQRDH